MALSQIQCLDENHVNWRVSESKPEFFYSEQQRLALEALIADGREAYDAYVKERELRPFLSEAELGRLCRSVQEFRPGAEPQKPSGATADGEDRAVSLQYWPDLSDVSIPSLDIGWPDMNSYRGVTRVNVYTQPPVDGQTHIKEVVRKAILQAQKTIAIVMDAFTDVDIFKDLLDAGFKRRVAVYVVIDQASIQDFLHMCGRVSMHSGHLKNLRVRCIGGSQFLTRSSRKVQGSLNQKFMFVDGDRAISGSYSFTWTASRLDRNIITVLTGQAVETFDKQFRELYFSSRTVNLSKVPLAEVPEPDPVPAPAPAIIPSATVAMKLINPKYSLVDTASRTSSDKASPKTSETPVPKPVKRYRDHAKEVPKHPGLVGLPRAELISYLPTWPEPDPPSDVIGFINIRDTSKPLQPHLMRSQLFETSQAIRFKDPFTAPPEDPLPEKACPRNKLRNAPKAKPDTHPVVEPAVKQESKVQSATPTENKPTVPPSENPDSKSNCVSAAKQAAQDSSCTTGAPPGPPVPKPRTMKLVMTTTGNDTQVSVVKKNESELQGTSGSEKYSDTPEELHSDPVTPDSDPTTQNHGVDVAAVLAYLPVEKGEGSSASDEYCECSISDGLVNGRASVSGHLGEHSSLNVMARFSNSMVDLRPGDADNPAERNLLNTHGRYTGKIHGQPPARETFNRTKVVVAKPGVYHRPSKSSTRIIGGHKYWNEKQSLAQSDAIRVGRAPGRSSPNRMGGLALPHAQSPSPRTMSETQTPLGIPVGRFSSHGYLRSRVTGMAGDKRAVYRSKES